MRKSLLLRKCEGPTEVSFHLYYDEVGKDPESFLVERDLLAPLFDSFTSPMYRVQSGRIDAEFRDFGTAC